jgi:hypothetical protein
MTPRARRNWKIIYRGVVPATVFAVDVAIVGAADGGRMGLGSHRVGIGRRAGDRLAGDNRDRVAVRLAPIKGRPSAPPRGGSGRSRSSTSADAGAALTWINVIRALLLEENALGGSQACNRLGTRPRIHSAQA